jgi:FkbM family methyltransferase
MHIETVFFSLIIAIAFSFIFLLIYHIIESQKFKLKLKEITDTNSQNTQVLALTLQSIQSELKEIIDTNYRNTQETALNLASIELATKNCISSINYRNSELMPTAISLDAGIIRRLDRVQNDLDFIKNHSSSYLGQGVGLTNLIDETPIYINSNDFGGPANFINGGKYEEEYFAVLASFKKPNSVFLDIGANLGIFSLRLAPMLRSGSIHAFEPNPKIRQLLERSVHLNGISSLVTIHGFGLSDQNKTLTFNVPEGHAGGGSVVSDATTVPTIKIDVKTLDSALPGLRFDIAKIDVEGHELHALRGMQDTLARSPEAVLIFEKLGTDSGIEADLLALFTSHGFNLYRIDGIRLAPVSLEEFKHSQAYFIAAAASTIGVQLDRNFLQVFPQDMFGVDGKIVRGDLIEQSKLPKGTVLFHGPYWYLPRGSYRLEILGKIEGEFNLSVTEKFGYTLENTLVTSANTSFNFIAHRDLTQFEVVGRSCGEAIDLRLSCIKLTRLG